MFRRADECGPELECGECAELLVEFIDVFVSTERSMGFEFADTSDGVECSMTFEFAALCALDDEEEDELTLCRFGDELEDDNLIESSRAASSPCVIVASGADDELEPAIESDDKAKRWRDVECRGRPLEEDDDEDEDDDAVVGGRTTLVKFGVAGSRAIGTLRRPFYGTRRQSQEKTSRSGVLRVGTEVATGKFDSV